LTRFSPVISTRADVPAEVFRKELEAALLGISDSNASTAAAIMADVFGALVADGKLTLSNALQIAHDARMAALRASGHAVDLAREVGA
jgi:hypothetical protein